MKSETIHQKKMKNETNLRIKKLKSDNSEEYEDIKFKKFCDDN